MRRFVARAAGVLLGLLVLVWLVGYVWMTRSLPATEGTVSVQALSAPVEIVRDRDAVPHIYAANRTDALFGLGYVHAQDRLWQMEFQRRIGHGQLSELFGRTTLPQDRFLRTVGFGRAARAAWAGMPADTRQQVDAYVAGINAFIASHHGSELPPEFSLLRFEPAPWEPADVIVWVKMIAWDLSANYSLELLRHDLTAAVGDARMRELMPVERANGPTIVGGGAGLPPASASQPGTPADVPLRRIADPTTGSWAQAFMQALAGGHPAVRDLLVGGSRLESLGSNNWVVDGTLSATGKPLLANDPHLGTKVPSTWYLAHMSAGDFDVIGATLPGAPAVALGRNRAIAWGATNVAADVEDLYRERLDPTGRMSEFKGVFEPLTIVQETIRVKGEEPVVLNVRIGRHGPLVSDAINANNAERKAGPTAPPLDPLAFRWTALDADDSTTTAFLRLNDARDWAAFREALRGLVAPAQNFVYADTAGHIGYYAAGRIPIRAKGDGAAPVEGWNGEFEWTGWVPFDELPHLADPPEHVIVTANNRPAPPDYPFHLGLEWPEPYRATRIIEMLRARPTHGLQDFARMQADTLSLHAKAMVPLLLGFARPANDMERQAVDLVRRWDADAKRDSAAAAIYEAWFLRVAPALLGDRLPAAVSEAYRGRYSYVTRFVEDVLTAKSTVWCREPASATDQRCEAEVNAALRGALDDLKQRLGGTPARWRWDEVHHAVFPHQGLDAVGALRPVFSRSMASGGDWSTINVGTVAVDAPFEQRSAAGYRQIVDLSAANDSRFLDAVGQAGHPFSPHYDDFLYDWQAVRYRRMRMDRADIEDGAMGRLRLTPAPRDATRASGQTSAGAAGGGAH